MKHEIYSSMEESESLPSLANLQAFEAAARFASFAEGAKAIGRTPSAISHAVRDLEHRLGEPLFERVGRNVQLTPAGVEYLQDVQAALTTLHAATQRLRRRKDKNVIRISALPFFTSAVLLPNLTRFEADNPDYDLRIETSSAYADVANGEADIAIRFGAARSEHLYCEPLIEIVGQPIASPDYLASHPPIRDARELQTHTLIQVRPDTNAWQTWATSQGLERLESSNTLTFDSILGALDAVKAGRGITLAMAPLIASYPGYGRSFVSILSPGASAGFAYNFVCRRVDIEDRKIQRTLAWLRSALKHCQEDGRTHSALA